MVQDVGARERNAAGIAHHSRPRCCRARASSAQSSRTLTTAQDAPGASGAHSTAAAPRARRASAARRPRQSRSASGPPDPPDRGIHDELPLDFRSSFHFNRNPVGHLLVELQSQAFADELGNAKRQVAVRERPGRKQRRRHGQMLCDGSRRTSTCSNLSALTGTISRNSKCLARSAMNGRRRSRGCARSILLTAAMAGSPELRCARAPWRPRGSIRARRRPGCTGPPPRAPPRPCDSWRD